MFIAANIFIGFLFALYQYMLFSVGIKQRPRRFGWISIILGELFIAAFAYSIYIIANG